MKMPNHCASDNFDRVEVTEQGEPKVTKEEECIQNGALSVFENFMEEIVAASLTSAMGATDAAGLPESRRSRCLKKRNNIVSNPVANQRKDVEFAKVRELDIFAPSSHSFASLLSEECLIGSF
jgi:hypothetical protein